MLLFTLALSPGIFLSAYSFCNPLSVLGGNFFHRRKFPNNLDEIFWGRISCDLNNPSNMVLYGSCFSSITPPRKTHMLRTWALKWYHVRVISLVENLGYLTEWPEKELWGLILLWLSSISHYVLLSVESKPINLANSGLFTIFSSLSSPFFFI